MPTTLPKFAVSQYTTYPLTFEQDIELYEQLGVDGIEICEEKLSDDPARAQEQLARVRESGLAVVSVQPQILSLFPNSFDRPDDPKTPKDRLNRYCSTIDLIAAAFGGQDIPLVTGGGIAPDFNFRLAHQTCRELYPQLADYAADRGLKLMFEPLNPILMNTFTFISSLNEAVKLIQDVDHANFGLNLDLWHLWQEPNIAPRIAGLTVPIFAVHISDWPKAYPRSFADRALPGEGIINLSELFAAIEQTGYDGQYCLEIFSDEKFDDSLWRRDPAELITTAREAFYHAWNHRKDTNT